MTTQLITTTGDGTRGEALTVLDGPVFSLRIEGRQVALVLQGAPLPGGAEISELVLSLPHVHFPFDFREGIERFRHHRGDAEVLEIGVDARTLLDWLHRVSDGRLGGTAHDDTLVLSGRTGDGARYTVRARIIADPPPPGEVQSEPTLLLTLYQVRVYGLVAEPWPVLAGRIIDLLPGELVVERTLTTARIRLVRPALAWALSAIGWKLPDLTRLQTRGAELRAGRLAARFLSTDAERQELLALDRVDDHGLRGAFERFVEDLELKRHHGQIDRLLAERQIREALAEIYRALDGPPQPGFLAERLIGICASQPVLYDEGARVCRDLLAIAPTYEPALCGLASIAIGRGRREDAASQLEKLASTLSRQTDREDATVCDLTVAELQRQTGQEDPRIALARVLERSPDHEEALEALIEISEAEGNTPATLPLYKRLLFAARSKERTRDAGLRLARHALECGQPEEARVFLRVVLEAAPDNVEAQVALAEVEQQEGNAGEAGRILDAALRAVPSTDEETTLRVVAPLARLCLDQLGDLARARRALWRVVDLVQLEAEGATALAKLALESQDPVLADRFLDRVGEGSPAWPQALALRAVAHLDKGDPGRALEVILGVLDAEPQNDTALQLLERCTPDLHQRELLIHRLKVSARTADGPESRARILHRVGTLYESLSLIWDSIGPYEEALDVSPDGPLAPTLTERLMALYATFGMWHEYQALCDKRLPRYRDPEKRVELLVGLGRVSLLELDEPEPARQRLQEAVELAPRNLEALELLRHALELLNQAAALIGVLSRLESIHPDEAYRNEVRIRLAELQIEALPAAGQARATLGRLPREAQADPRVRGLRRRVALSIDPEFEGDDDARHASTPATGTVGPAGAASGPSGAWEAALQLADRGAFSEAVGLLEELLSVNPSDVPARELMSLLEARLEEARRSTPGPAAAAGPVEGLKPPHAPQRSRIRASPPPRASGTRDGRPRSDEVPAPPAWVGASPMPAEPPDDHAPGDALPLQMPADAEPGARLSPELALVAEHARQGDELESALARADRELARGNHAPARDALAGALEIDPDCIPALEKMNEVLDALGDHQGRASVLDRLSENVFDAEQSVGYLRELGALYADALDDAARAFEVWQRYLVWRPLDEEVFERVRLDMLARGKQSALAELYERRAEAALDAADERGDPAALRRSAARSLLHAAMLRLADLDAPAAIAAAERGLALVEDEPELLETLVRSLVVAGDKVRAREVAQRLVPQLLDTGLKEELEELTQ